MQTIQDVDAFIVAMQAFIKFVEVLDPNAANNPVVIKIQKVISSVESFMADPLP